MSEEVVGGLGNKKLRFRKPSPFRILRPTLALSAFVMSLTIALIGAYHSLLGAEIIVQPPEQVIFYRDGEDAHSVLSIAVRANTMNTATGYGDVLTSARISVGQNEPSFKYDGIVKPIFVTKNSKIASDCESDANCIRLNGLIVVQQPDELVAVPGDSAKGMTLGFTLGCGSTIENCNNYKDYLAGFDLIRRIPLTIRMVLDFHSDGRREIICSVGRLTRAKSQFLHDSGWVSAKCLTTSVSGDRVL